MQIWVDADACPKAIKEILFRAAERLKVTTTFIANQLIRTPASRYIRAIQVSQGFDVADDKIIQQVEPGDLVITADIALAAAVLERGGQALNSRGEVYTEENIREHLNVRDLLDGLRASGVATGGPPPLSSADRQAFANQLDRFLLKRV
jgi:uncharacterized protein YaiI (UPF0178 family)